MKEKVEMRTKEQVLSENNQALVKQIANLSLRVNILQSRLTKLEEYLRVFPNSFTSGSDFPPGG